ncbi:dihydrolipoamide dehydrogenase [Candidatus Methanoperedens nitroreducens]|uniref:Dihydrolipoyl dehydrogenase n=1 Tax=Candidatus Methanoperedens nitratireducens TaxID=1392998 RepID=A0A062V0L6_9EURY|nr:dihydrolipoyl dehydrogenase [Candidatus Methanoperedens nitroreducens]KCZ70907.1 dihydrolipoamide dehydrogenase [Candidatus Methanoperedens nitroreducens]MDJ1421725.1 dihydrolipoyl dehydrogenase [Candidatus Methanoperedens sp.]
MVVGDLVTGCDVLVVGGGPGGYVAAIRASQLGKDVILVEKDELGGVCTNHGCIPSKALIHAANLIHDMKNPGDIGIKSSVEFDFKKIQEWNSGVVKRLRDGIGYLCKKYGVEVTKGEAYLESSERARITLQDGRTSTLKFKNAIIATGSRSSEFPEFPYDGQLVISSKEALSLSEVPVDMVIIGAGYISIELGTMFAKLGTRVKIIQRSPRILTRVESEAVEIVSRKMEKLGIEVYLNSKPEGMRIENGRARVAISSKDTEKRTELAADKILVAVGVDPNSNNIGLENTGVELDKKGFIKVDERRRTTDTRIYAIGDVAGPPFLAHKAFREGKVAAEVIAGLPGAFDNRAVPAVIFSDPEIATVGLDEESAKESGFEISTGKFPFRASGRALTMDRTDGFVKVVANKKNGELLGIHIVGANASELISEASLSIEMAAFLEDMAVTIHPHPTLPEALAEAAEAALGRAIHI